MKQTVRVPLASNTLYVTGTVNGVDKIWTREEGNIWSTAAERATDGVYRVALSIIYSDGKTTTDSVTLYYGLVLVTDRTQADVTNGTEKGYYNASDLNRVGSAMAYLRDRFVDNGYDVDISPYTTWKDADIPDKDDMTLYLGCLGTLRGVLPVPDGTPDMPSTMEYLTYITANDIEKILETVDDTLTKSLSFVWYSGDLYAGEVM